MKFKYLFIVLTFFIFILGGCLEKTIHIDFENISSSATGNSFDPGTVLTDNNTGVKIVVLPFQWSNGNSTSTGFAEIVSGNKAGGSGKDIHCDNVCLGFIIPESEININKFTAKFGEYGGNINLIVNDKWQNFENFDMIPSPILSPNGGSVTINVSSGLPLGTIELLGKINNFYESFPVETDLDSLYSIIIGGQELWLDDVIFSE